MKNAFELARDAVNRDTTKNQPESKPPETERDKFMKILLKKGTAELKRLFSRSVALRAVKKSLDR